MTTPSDEPSQSSQSTDTANIYITDTDKIVVNKLLTFVCDKVNSLPYDMIVKLIVDFYSDDDVATDKNILFQAAFFNRDAPRLFKRQGKDKKLNNIQDILNIFLEVPPQSAPCYVTKELSSLPPLSMNCFDVSSLVKDTESLKLPTYVNSPRIPRNLSECATRYVSRTSRNCTTISFRASFS